MKDNKIENRITTKIIIGDSRKMVEVENETIGLVVTSSLFKDIIYTFT
ncbi:MAG: hypothetical protein N2043_09170 [Ignavibacterium sp.]|nr:hypothetical protein [Ignavibacterium sp.]